MKFQSGVLIIQINKIKTLIILQWYYLKTNYNYHNIFIIILILKIKILKPYSIYMLNKELYPHNGVVNKPIIKMNMVILRLWY